MDLVKLLIDEDGILFKQMNAIHQGTYRNLVNWLGSEMLPFMPMNARYFTDHGISHSQGIIEALDNLLQGIKDQMTSLEALILLSSVWLHDIGMLISVDENGRELSEKEVRDQHSTASARWIRKYHDKWGLRSDQVVEIIAKVCEYHSRKAGPISRLESEWAVEGEKKPVRLRFLAGLMRLGDSLDFRSNRAPEAITEYFVRLPIESRLHWRLYKLIKSLSMDFNKGEIKIDAEYDNDRAEADIALILWKVGDIQEELASVQDTLQENEINLNKVFYRYRRKGNLEVSTQDQAYGYASEIKTPAKDKFRQALLAEYEWNVQQIFKVHSDSRVVITHFPPSIVGADIYHLAARTCVEIESFGTWDKDATETDKIAAARYHHEAGMQLNKLPLGERNKYFYHAIMAYHKVAERQLSNDQISPFEEIFITDSLRIQKALDFLENKIEGVPGLDGLCVLRAGRTDFHPRIYQDIRRLMAIKINDRDYAHNGCSLCTARAISTLILAGEGEFASRLLVWLQNCEKDWYWRVIGLRPEGTPRLMSFAYTANALEAVLDMDSESPLADKIASVLLKNQPNWNSDLERGSLDTKSHVLRSLYRYVRVRQYRVAEEYLEMLWQGVKNFLDELQTCQNEQERIEGISGTLFWREASQLSKTMPIWADLIGQLKKQGEAIQNAYHKDNIWDTEDGSWGYNESRTAYLVYGWLSYWDYVWAGEQPVE